MPSKLLFLLVFLLSATSLFAQTEQIPEEIPFNYKKDFKRLLDSSQDRGSGLYYYKLLKRFMDNDSSLTNPEVLALMIGYTENPYFKPLKDMEREQAIFDLNKDGQFRETIRQGKIFIQTHPLSLLVLREISYAYQMVSKKEFQPNLIMDSAVLYQDSGKYFMDLNDKIMEAMIYSGKGRTPENPIFSLGLADGETFIPNVGFRIDTDGQKDRKDTEWNKDGYFLEVITALVDNVNVRKYYFIIEHAKKRIDDDEANELAAQKAEKARKEEELKKKKGKKNAKDNKTKTTPAIDLNTPSSDSTQIAPPVNLQQAMDSTITSPAATTPVDSLQNKP